MLNVKKTLTKILTALTVEDISDKVKMGGAWTAYHKQAYLVCGKFAFVTIQAYTSTFVAGAQYTVATISSGYRPSKSLPFTGHATDQSFAPQAVLNCWAYADGSITARASNTNGSHFFLSCWYKLEGGN